MIIQTSTLTEQEFIARMMNEAVVIPDKGLGVIAFAKRCDWIEGLHFGIVGVDDLWIEWLTYDEFKLFTRGDLYQDCLECGRSVRIDKADEDCRCEKCQQEAAEAQDEGDDDQYPDFHVSDFLFSHHMRAR